MSGSIEEFDDDTDFALPTVPAPSQGGAGAADPQGGMSMESLQQMMAQMGGGSVGPSGPSGASMPPGMMGMMGGAGGAGLPPNVDLSSEEKKWITVYPIYFDAKRRYEKGCRRVAYAQSSMWPQSKNIEQAAQRLTLMHVHEGRKCHPNDWQNPGRVKVQLFSEEGKPLNAKLKTKKDLLRAIAEIIQPQCGGTPPALPEHPKKPVVKAAKTADETAKASGKGKAAAKGATASPGGPYKNAKPQASKPQHRLPIRIDAKDRIRADSAQQREKRTSGKAVTNGRLPPYSPCKEAGLLNADLGGMMGGLQGMGPLGAMMGSMGLGGDDDEEAEGEGEQESLAEKKKKDPMQQLSRRQRKRVVRIGR